MDSGLPTLQGRVGLSWSMGDRQASVGLYAHRGKETLGPELYGESVSVGSSGWGSDLTLPLGPTTLSGEVWTGTNLDDYFGGIGQGVTLGALTAVGVTSSGGWGQLAWPIGMTELRVGAGVDDPDEADLPTGGRARNFSFWAGVERDIGAGLRHGVEVSRWVTDYVGLARGTSVRVQMSIVYVF